MATAKSTPKVTEATPPVEDAPVDAVKVQVRSTPIVSDPVSEVSTKADLTVHHELTIAPTGDVSDKPAEDAAPVVKPEPVRVEVPAPAAAAPVELVKTSEAALLQSPEPPVDDAPKTEPMPATSQASTKNESSDAKAMADKEMQSPKVFDTKQYHLPIDEGVTHGKGKFVMIFFVVLLLLVLGATVAIDAGWIKPGFDLPFDLIK